MLKKYQNDPKSTSCTSLSGNSSKKVFFLENFGIGHGMPEICRGAKNRLNIHGAAVDRPPAGRTRLI